MAWRLGAVAGCIASAAVVALDMVVAITAVAAGPGLVAAAAAAVATGPVTAVAGSVFLAACQSVLMQWRAGAVGLSIAGRGAGTVAALS